MTMPAVVMALEALSRPDIVPRQMRRPLPSDLIELIRCAAGDRETIERVAAERDISENSLIEASKFFLHHVINSGGNDNYRTLGLAKTAGKEDVREHRRWLLKWLHPDRNPSKWEATLFLKVEKAANTLLSSDAVAVVPETTRMRSRSDKKRPRSSRAYGSAALIAEGDSEQSLQRMRRLMLLSCLGLSFLTLLLFGISEWYPLT
jgi:hypothetical protein